MHKHNEVCSSIQRGTWGYCPLYENRTADELRAFLKDTNAKNCNLLLNAGPMADGAISPIHQNILLDINA